jgi:hypothetical protein
MIESDISLGKAAEYTQQIGEHYTYLIYYSFTKLEKNNKKKGGKTVPSVQ